MAPFPRRPTLTIANVNKWETGAEIASQTYPAITGHDCASANLVTMRHARSEDSGSAG